MPIPKTLVVRPKWIAAQHPMDWLTETELITYRQWQSPKRRAEWLAGRLAAKHLIGDTTGSAPLTFAIGREGVAPCIVSGESLPWTLSLSHSHGLGAATVSDLQQEGSAGVDVQCIRPVHPGLCARVFTGDERDQIAGRFGQEDDPAGMLLFWALKEAAIKARRAAWGRPLRQIEVRLMDDGRAVVQMVGEPPLRAAYEEIGGWWLARVVQPPR